MLVGRREESERIRGLLQGARGGRSGVLVVQGEAGVGKTALLDSAIESASDFRVVRSVGVESEMELPFATLHQLCISMLDRLERLPIEQYNALAVIFGLRAGTGPRPFHGWPGHIEPRLGRCGGSAALVRGGRCAMVGQRLGTSARIRGAPALGGVGSHDLLCAIVWRRSGNVAATGNRRTARPRCARTIAFGHHRSLGRARGGPGRRRVPWHSSGPVGADSAAVAGATGRWLRSPSSPVTRRRPREGIYSPARSSSARHATFLVPRSSRPDGESSARLGSGRATRA